MNHKHQSPRVRSGVWVFALIVFGLVLSQPSTAEGQTGSGTAGKVTKWTGTFGNSSTVLGNSVITESDSGNIGIGNTNPQAKVHLYGTSGDIGLRIESGPGGATRLDLYSTVGGAADRNWT